VVVAQAKKRLTEQLAQGGVEAASFEAWELVGAVLGKVRPSALAALHAHPVSQTQWSHLKLLASRRTAGEPLQYILGEWDFYGRTFQCRPGTFIPRPETELLVDTALEFLRKNGYVSTENNRAARVLDLCCGSGCVGLTLALEGGCLATLIDISPDAIALTQENAKRLGVHTADFLLADVLTSYERLGSYDLIVCNPPYVRSDEMQDLPKEVAFEPCQALDGGEDGLVYYRALTEHWLPNLAIGGALVVEHGAGQGSAVTDLFLKAKLSMVSTKEDLSGIDRVTRGLRVET